MSFLAGESQLLTWKKQGLPSDTYAADYLLLPACLGRVLTSASLCCYSLSMQNGIIILNSIQCPYVIDPNGQAAAFLRKSLESKTLDVIMQQDPKFVTLLETAVRFGRTLIVLEADRVLPIVYPLLRRDLFKKGGRVFVQVGDKEYDYNENFRLFLVTRNTDPDITGMCGPPLFCPLLSAFGRLLTCCVLVL
jgi:dynein heavy chain 2